MKKTSKLKPPINYDFESSNQRYDFTKICRDMQKSNAWQQLTLRQQRIIFMFEIEVYCKFKNFKQ